MCWVGVAMLCNNCAAATLTVFNCVANSWLICTI